MDESKTPPRVRRHSLAESFARPVLHHEERSVISQSARSLSHVAACTGLGAAANYVVYMFTPCKNFSFAPCLAQPNDFFKCTVEQCLLAQQVLYMAFLISNAVTILLICSEDEFTAHAREFEERVAGQATPHRRRSTWAALVDVFANEVNCCYMNILR
jgi:hypothetical protein